MSEASIFLEVGLVIGIATVLSLIGRGVKQPNIIAYLIAGIIAGPIFLNLINSTELIGLFAHVGITFLLFVVGLSLDFTVLKNVGRVAAIAGLSQFLITSFLGYFLALNFGFTVTQSFFLGVALAISSTIVAMNLLTEKNETETLHGKITLGILIFQDLLAAVALLALPVIVGHTSIEVISLELLKGIALITGIFIFSGFIIPPILNLAAKSQEELFLFSIGWALLISALFHYAGFSIEIGALIAGMSLASSKFSLEISSKIKGLREFFTIIHLVFFGSLLTGPISSPVVYPAIAFSALVLIGNPLIVMTCMKLSGFKKRTNFLTGVSIAQISELSLILIFLGFSLNVLTQTALNIIILTALITIAISSYMIYHSDKCYTILSPLLNSFEGHGAKTELIKLHPKYDVILFGYNRIGFNILKALKKKNLSCLVVDFNPQTVHKLRAEGYHCLYGDADDSEFLQEVGLWRAKKVISTVPDLETNSNILKILKEKNKSAVFLPTSHSIKDTFNLYAKGANYVIMPHFLGGSYLGSLISKDKITSSELKSESKEQLKELRERTAFGQVHPNKDRHEK